MTVECIERYRKGGELTEDLFRSCGGMKGKRKEVYNDTLVREEWKEKQGQEKHRNIVTGRLCDCIRGDWT